MRITGPTTTSIGWWSWARPILTQRGTGAGGGAELDARLRLMERAGVEMQVLSASPQLPYGEDPDKTMKLARFVNDEYAEPIDQQWDRFRAFADLPLPHTLHPSGNGRRAGRVGNGRRGHEHHGPRRALVQPDFEPIFAALNERGTTLYLHPAGNSACSPPDRRLPPDLDGRSAGRGHHFHNAANYGGYPHPLPEHHDHQLTPWRCAADVAAASRRPISLGGARNARTPERGFGRMWYDTVGHGHVPALKCAIESFGVGTARTPDRLSLRSGRHLRAGCGVHRRSPRRRQRGPGYPRPERRRTARDRVARYRLLPMPPLRLPC